MNHVDTMIELQRANEDAPIIMHCDKQRDGAEHFPDIKLQLEQVELGINFDTLEPLTSCVVVSSQAKTVAETIAAETATAEQETMLDLLKLHKRLTVNKWIAACKEAGVSKRAFYAHIKTLKAEQRVTYQEPASKGKPAYFELAAPVEQETLVITESEQEA